MIIRVVGSNAQGGFRKGWAVFKCFVQTTLFELKSGVPYLFNH